MKLGKAFIFSTLLMFGGTAAVHAGQDNPALPDLTQALQARIDAQIAQTLQAALETGPRPGSRNPHLTPETTRKYVQRPAQDKVS